MSRGWRGGGRGGRGGGGGGMYSNPLLKGFLEDMSAEEAKKLLHLKEPTSLFPDYQDLRPAEKPTEYDEAALVAQRLFRDELQRTAFYLAPPPPPKDVERYSDRYHVVPESEMRPPLTAVQTSLAFFPEELHQVVNPAKTLSRKKAIDSLGVNFDEFEKMESKGDKEGKEENAEEEPNLEEEEEEDLDEEGDYGENYFDNGEGDDDLDGGGGDED